MLTLISRSALLTLIAATSVWAQGDGTGCNMAPGTALRDCLGSYASLAPVAPTGLSRPSEAAYYCDMYTQMANCWAVGLYCREWLPLRIAADKFCALANGTTLDATMLSSAPFTALTTIPTTSVETATSNATASATATASGSLPTVPSSFAVTVTASMAGSLSDSGTVSTVTNVSIATATLSSVIAEASNVITSIWNNDVGTAIPSITNDVGTLVRPTWTQVTTLSTSSVVDPFGQPPSAVGAVAASPSSNSDGTSLPTAVPRAVNTGASARSWDPRRSATAFVTGGLAILLLLV